MLVEAVCICRCLVLYLWPWAWLEQAIQCIYHPPCYLLMCLFCNHSLKSNSMVQPMTLKGRRCIKMTRRASSWSVGIRRENVLMHNMRVLYQKKILHGCFSWLKTSYVTGQVLNVEKRIYSVILCTTFLSVGFLLLRNLFLQKSVVTFYPAFNFLVHPQWTSLC